MENTGKAEMKGKLDASGYRRILQLVVTTAAVFLVIFVPAGTLDWPMAWAYMGIVAAAYVFMGFVLYRLNPQIINERGKSHRDAKTFDRVLEPIGLVLMIAMYVTAGLDAKRFMWSAPMPLSLIGLGIGLFILSVAVTAWTVSSNPFFETRVRIQDDRGHKVCDRGPYAFLRHPGYVGFIIMNWSAPLVLESWWAMVPAGLSTLLIVVRTYLEDSTLKRELPGYLEYSKRVRYRLLPFIF